MLTRLDVSLNPLTGTIPQQLGALPRAASSLYSMIDTQITGEMREESFWIA